MCVGGGSGVSSELTKSGEEVNEEKMQVHGWFDR